MTRRRVPRQTKTEKKNDFAFIKNNIETSYLKKKQIIKQKTPSLGETLQLKVFLPSATAGVTECYCGSERGD